MSARRWAKGEAFQTAAAAFARAMAARTWSGVMQGTLPRPYMVAGS